MGKVTNFSGQPVYNQLLNLLDKQKICEISHSNATIEINGRWYIYCETTSDGFRIGNISKKESVKDFETILELRA